ncbi:MAG: uroporphyrinogen decarboxylase family protein [Candidatus Oleimicrobiaceae bacterium]
MTGKQRVLATLAGEEPDRVPIGEFAIDFDTVEKIIGHETYLRAKAKSQIAFWEGRHDEVADSYLRDHIELHRKLDLDIVTFPMATWEIPAERDEPPPRRLDDLTWEDRQGRIYRYSPVTADITCIKDPVLERTKFRPEDFAAPLPVPIRDERSWRVLEGVIQELKAEKFICGPSGGEIGIVFLGGLERGCLELAENVEAVKAATHQLLAQQMAADKIFMHPDSDAVLWGVDFAHKGGPFISPQLFRELFLEPNKARVQQVHQVFGKKVMKHCCGNVHLLLDAFVEIGYDAYQSIQPSAGMDICQLKQSVGRTLTLWGGVAVEHLVSGTPEDVRKDVRRAMACAKQGGRFILGSSHSIAVGTRYDNFMAMLDEYHRLCAY